jgi:hypothetical protein
MVYRVSSPGNPSIDDELVAKMQGRILKKTAAKMRIAGT